MNKKMNEPLIENRDTAKLRALKEEKKDRNSKCIHAIFPFLMIFCLVLAVHFSVLTAQDNVPVKLDISPEMQDIQDRGYLVVGLVNQDQPPFFYTNVNGEFTGYDIDLAKDIGEKLGVEIRYNRESQSFNDLIPLVASGKADIIISKLSRTSTRALTVLFTRPYITFYQALMVNRVALARVASTDPEIAGFIKNFRGKIGVIAKSSYVNYASNNFPNAEVVEYPSWEEAVNAVFSGDILAAYRDELEIKKIIKSRPNASLLVKTVLLSDTEDNISMAVSWKSAHLHEWLNLYLSQATLKKNAEDILFSYSDIFSFNK